MWVDFNHQLNTELCETSYKQWIQEYKIDGFRWDLTLHKIVLQVLQVVNCTCVPTR
jgi:pullulanase/glycogen debranching enzyme